METMSYDCENGLRMIAVYGNDREIRSSMQASSVRHVVTETPMQVLDRIEASNINLNKRLDRLEAQGNAALVETDEVQPEISSIDEDVLVNRVIGLASSDPVTKRKTLNEIETEGMSREEARESLEEDLLVDRILKRGGK
ncbi:MAG: hypothetical protein GX654_02785 [Desulfatiglans sp.]|nr:hypothetical protein [Desulfatiglans sp.]